MPLRSGRLVGEVAATVPEAITAFRVAGIDCCREAHLTLRDASMRSGIRPDRLSALLREGSTPAAAGGDWRDAPLRDLIRHIVEAIHPTAIASMETISSRFASTALATPNDWSIAEIRSAFAEVANNLVIHVWRVENEVFPCIAQLEADCGSAAVRLTSEDFPDPRDPMIEGLRRLRAVAAEYAREPGTPLAALLDDVRTFDDALHRHIHLEHHVLYPRAAGLCAHPSAEADPPSVLTWA